MEEGRSEKFRGKIRKGGWSFMTKTTSSLPCFFSLSKNKMLIRFDVDLVDDRERKWDYVSVTGLWQNHFLNHRWMKKACTCFLFLFLFLFYGSRNAHCLVAYLLRYYTKQEKSILASWLIFFPLLIQRLIILPLSMPITPLG